jgi:hypothetical protein
MRSSARKIEALPAAVFGKTLEFHVFSMLSEHRTRPSVLHPESIGLAP